MTDAWFANIAQALKAAEIEVAQTLAKEAETTAKSLAPVETGNLRDSIHAQGDTVVAEADYAFATEYGSAKKAAHPFMTPALEKAKDSAEIVAKQILDNNLK